MEGCRTAYGGIKPRPSTSPNNGTILYSLAD